MRTVAEGYGLEISRGGMALCPFHNERTPSAKIYPDALHCFGCGTHVDVIGFTQKMFGLDKPIDAVKKLNDDYALHIEIGKAPTAEKVSEYQKRVREKRAYEECDERFVYSLHHLDYAEYLCFEFINCNKAGRLSMKNIVAEIADFQKK